MRPALELAKNYRLSDQDLGGVRARLLEREDEVRAVWMVFTLKRSVQRCFSTTELEAAYTAGICPTALHRTSDPSAQRR